MTHPYIPPQPGGPGAYEQQLAARCRRLEQDRFTLETELGQARQRNAELQQRAETAEAERDGAYRERAHLTAWLASIFPAVLAPAPDVDEPGWRILYLYAEGQQFSWHIHPRDAELYGHVEQVSADDPRAQWDGHTTDQKYEAIRAMPFGELRRPTAEARP